MLNGQVDQSISSLELKHIFAHLVYKANSHSWPYWQYYNWIKLIALPWEKILENYEVQNKLPFWIQNIKIVVWKCQHEGLWSTFLLSFNSLVVIEFWPVITPFSKFKGNSGWECFWELCKVAL